MLVSPLPMHNRRVRRNHHHQLSHLALVPATPALNNNNMHFAQESKEMRHWEAQGGGFTAIRL